MPHAPDPIPHVVRDYLWPRASTGAPEPPTAHYSHPMDETLRIARCGRPMLGLETGDFEFVLCEDCAFLAFAGDYAPLPA